MDLFSSEGNMEVMKVLVVEDQPNVVSFLRRGLMEVNYEVSVAMDGVTALNMIRANLPDIVLLDVMLPEMNGIDLARRIRKEKIPTSIIMITALGTSENVVTGLDSGADDYIVKPFAFTELLARINAVVRRAGSNGLSASTIRISDLEIDTRGKSSAAATPSRA